MLARLGERRPWTVAAGSVAAVFCVANRALVTGRAWPIWDADEFFAPYHMLVADFARARRFLLWNPWINGGSPDFADPQTGAFSPLVLLTALAGGGSEPGFRFYWLTIWLVAGVGTLALARHLRAPVWGGVVATLGFLFSGFFTGHAEHTSFLHAVAWVPMIIWRLDASIESRRLWPAVQAGAIWGFSGLAGYPGLLILSGGFALLWAGGRWLCGPARGRDVSLRARTSWLALPAFLFLLTGLVVLAPPYAGFLVHGQGFTHRVGPLPRETATGSNALHPGALATFASPYLPTLKAYNAGWLWPYTDISSAGLYVGPLVTVLALFALVARPRDPWRWFLLAVAGLSLALAMGSALPLRGWLYDVYPPARYFRHAAVFRFFTIFSVVVLALVGARDFSAGLRRQNWWLALLALGAGAAAAMAYHGVMWRLPNPGPERTLAGLHLWLVWTGVAVAGVLGGLLSADRRRVLLPGALVLIAVGDALLTQRLSEPTIYTKNPRWGRIWDRIARERRHELAVDWVRLDRAPREIVGPGRNNKNLALKIPIFDGYTPFDSPFRLEWLKHPALVEAATGSERIWFAAKVVETAPSPLAFDRFVKRSAAMGSPVVLVHRQAQFPSMPEGNLSDGLGPTSIDALPAARRVPFTILTYQPEELVFTVRCPADGWLLVTDRWAAGWTATVNGVPTPVRTGNFIFRAIPVGAGENLVRFVYVPFGYPWLLVASWGALAAVASGPVWHRVRNHGALPLPGSERGTTVC